jgi:hypothetical protein
MYLARVSLSLSFSLSLYQLPATSWIDERFSLADNLSREIVKKEDGQFQPSLPVNLRCVSLVHVVRQKKKKKRTEIEKQSRSAEPNATFSGFFSTLTHTLPMPSFIFLMIRERGKLRENA